MRASTAMVACRAKRVAVATPSSRASLVLTRPATGTLAMITSRQRKGAADVRGARRFCVLQRDLVMIPLTVRQALMAVKT